MDYKGTISAVARTLIRNRFEQGAQTGETKAESIAQARYNAKLEVPNSNLKRQRRESCWRDWLEFDSGLQPSSILGPHWAYARLFLHSVLRDYKYGSVDFTNGSEFEPTRGFNSIESKLRRSKWTCTHDNFDLWCLTVYRHRALKIAMRKRWSEHLQASKLVAKSVDRELYRRFKQKPNYGFEIFSFKLSCITTFVQGNRFSTVPKNNSVDRPICIEPLANILTQRRIGIGFRNSLLKLGIDLKHVAEQHRVMIASKNYATIDLKNASDSIHLSLVKYLLPKRIFDYIEQARSAMTFGLDDQFHLIEKVSSMGNGFTFELMSLILYALCRSYTTDCSVFGDDIIVPNAHASSVIHDLQLAGFVVNVKKTHIDDEYRESCGAHFIDGHGYVESYDFRYPSDIGECITIYNKLVRLSLIYPSFQRVFNEVYELMPPALIPGSAALQSAVRHHQQDATGPSKLDTYCISLPNCGKGLKWSKSAWRTWRRFCRFTHNDPNGASLHYGFEWVDRSSQPTVLYYSNQWAKYLMYLSSGRKCKDTVTGRGAYKSFTVVTDKHGSTLRWTAVLTATK